MSDQRELKPCPLTGEWRHGNGAICCGTLRIARADFDTDPDPEYQREILDYLCASANQNTRHTAPEVQTELASLLREVVSRFADEDLESPFIAGRLKEYSSKNGVNLEWLANARAALARLEAK